jgi:SPP1 gp7 family putative phage head morphogenesis protein
MTTEIDAYALHQVYLEGYKDGEADKADAMYEEIAAVIALLLLRWGYTSVGEIPKRKLNSFIAEVNKRVKIIFNKYANITLNDLKAFFSAELGIMGSLTGSGKTDVSKAGALWANILNRPISGVGVEPSTIFSVTIAAALAELVRAIKRGYADNQTIAELLASIVGTKARKFKDGLIAKLKRQWRTAVQTTIQHISSSVMFHVAALTHDHYTWIAILDSRTTEICRSRNGKTYAFADGPRPPAHWNCRSFIVPVTVAKLEDMPTFYTWVKRQPATIQNDVLGAERGQRLRAGALKSSDLPGFDYTRPLTLAQYKDRLNKLLNKVA